ncbi:unnamed protein product [Enterobius vermicularis]|uniref:Kinesin motor domain-containing protein n=1 Tax=Enterobius vermicularis TaxID=51028 RepID=A0A0N4V0W5_ENTVE|nr:unnamed protein product [Enterobius vermicularis]
MLKRLLKGYEDSDDGKERKPPPQLRLEAKLLGRKWSEGSRGNIGHEVQSFRSAYLKTLVEEVNPIIDVAEFESRMMVVTFNVVEDNLSGITSISGSVAKRKRRMGDSTNVISLVMIKQRFLLL